MPITRNEQLNNKTGEIKMKSTTTKASDRIAVALTFQNLCTEEKLSVAAVGKALKLNPYQYLDGTNLPSGNRYLAIKEFNELTPEQRQEKIAPHVKNYTARSPIQAAKIQELEERIARLENALHLQPLTNLGVVKFQGGR